VGRDKWGRPHGLGAAWECVQFEGENVENVMFLVMLVWCTEFGARFSSAQLEVEQKFCGLKLG